MINKYNPLNKIIFVLALIVLSFVARGAWAADVPQIINYQGTLTNATGTAVPDDWITQVIDPGRKFWEIQSLVFDKNGQAHILYGGATLYYAHYDDSKWVYESLATDIPGASLAVDSRGRAHVISYSEGALSYTTNSSGAWVRRLLFNDGHWKRSPSIAVDSKDDVHISFQYYTNCTGSACENPTSDLRYATNRSGTWNMKVIQGRHTVGDVLGRFNSIAIDSNDHVHISYLDGMDSIGDYYLKYAMNVNGAWATTTVDSTGDVGAWNSIDVDSKGVVHIGYLDSTNHAVKYATNFKRVWEAKRVGPTGISGRYISISVDSADKIHIAFVDNIDLLWYGTNTSGSWLMDKLGQFGKLKSGVSLAIDSLDRIHFIDSLDRIHLAIIRNTGALNLLTNRGGSSVSAWVSQPVDKPKDVGQYSSLAVDQLGKMHISYFDALNGDLKYATNSTSTDAWRIQTIDRTGAVGYYTSIAVDSADNVHISYFDKTNRDLKYATNKGGSWVTYALDSNGDVGHYSSVAIDSRDNIHISYTDGTGQLKYVNNKNGVWAISIIDASGGVKSQSSLAIDSLNKVHIAYRAYTPAGYLLKYATNASGQWSITNVEQFFGSVTLGPGPVLALDTAGKAHIAFKTYVRTCSSFYCYNQDKFLWYATNSTGNWGANAIDESDMVGGHTSIAVDSEGHIHISYYRYYFYDYMSDEGVGYLTYITNASGSWFRRTIESVFGAGLYTSICTRGSGVHISYYDEANGQLKVATSVP